MEEVRLPNKDYILFYYAENLPTHIKDQIFDYAKEHGLAVYGAGECDRRYSAVTVNLTPFQWVWMFRNARFVITGTFHGAAFSIGHDTLLFRTVPVSRWNDWGRAGSCV